MKAWPFLVLPVAALTTLCGAAAHGEDSPTAPGCEFHVWTSQGLSFVGQGATAGGSFILPSGTMASVSGDYVGQGNVIDGLVRSDPADRSSPLSPARQLELLAGLNLAEEFGLGDYHVTFHDEAIPSITLRRKNARLTGSTSSCYAELVLQDVAYSVEYGRNDKLRTLFFFRKFAGEEIEQRFSSFTQQKLEMKPRKMNVDWAAWKAGVTDAFTKNVEEFAALVNK